MNRPEPILSVEDLFIHYRSNYLLFSRPSVIAAVQGVTFEVYDGETVAIVGESGSGKTSVMMSILRFIKPITGCIKFKETDIWGIAGEELRETRRKIQSVFQNPHNSLSPRKTAGRAVEDGLWTKDYKDTLSKQEKLLKLFKTVGLGEEHLDCYPFQLSGGQKQRVCLARALAPSPELLILDEPLSAQDLSIQAHLINLLSDLKRQKNLTYLLISHDLRIVRSLAQRIAVMKDGIFVEVSDTDTIFNHPEHSYTKSLLEGSGY